MIAMTSEEQTPVDQEICGYAAAVPPLTLAQREVDRRCLSHWVYRPEVISNSMS